MPAPMLRRVHLIIGIAAIVAFLLSGQQLGHHHPTMEQLPPELRMMYVSRHIYLLAGALVNTVLGLYLQLQTPRWRRVLASTPDAICNQLLLRDAQTISLFSYTPTTLPTTGPATGPATKPAPYIVR